MSQVGRRIVGTWEVSVWHRLATLEYSARMKFAWRKLLVFAGLLASGPGAASK